MTWEDFYQLSKDARDMHELAQASGLKLRTEGRDQFKAPSPFNNEKTPSCHIYPDHWKDFSSGKHGDALDWLEQVDGLSPEQAREERARQLGVTLPQGDPGPRATTFGQGEKQEKPAAAPEWIDDLVTQAHAALMKQDRTSEAWIYLEARGLAGMAEALRLGVVSEAVKVPQLGKKIKDYRGRIIIPTLEDYRATWFKARYLGPLSDAELKAQGSRKYDGPSGSVPAPFNADAIKRAPALGFLVLTEGELDAASLLAAYGEDYGALGLSGGLLPKGWAEKIAETGAAVYLLMDSDTAGAARADSLRAELSGLGVKVYNASPKPYNDVNEALQALGSDGLVEHVNAALEASALELTSDLLYIREGWLSALDARANRPHAAYTTGIEALDSQLDGGYIEGLHLLGGITGGGKTSLALAIALHNALEGRSVIYGSYEQSRLELWARIASRLTSVPYGAIKRGTFDRQGTKTLASSELKASEGWAKLEQAAKHLKVVEGGDAYSRTSSTWTVEVLTTTARAIAEDRGAPPLIILDYLQRMPAPPSVKIKETRERVSYIAGALQVNLAREIGCPVLALSSISRASYRLADAELEGRLAAFKEAGELEYTAYTALLLYGLPEAMQDRLNFAPGVMANYRPMTLDLCKHREGRPGRLAVKWWPARDSWEGAQAWPEGKA